MAKFELKFIDDYNDYATQIVKSNYEGSNKGVIVITITNINDESDETVLHFDKSTAIKFAKTLRTEINKITESEVNNG